MASVSDLQQEIRRLRPPPPPIDGGGGNGNDGRMDTEKRLTAIETALPTLATKTDVVEMRADLHKMDASIKTWMLGTVVTIIGAMLAAIFGVAQMFRLATPPSAPTAAQQPAIIINVPPSSTAPVQK